MCRVEKFKEKFPTDEEYKINDIASKFEEKFFDIATDKVLKYKFFLHLLTSESEFDILLIVSLLCLRMITFGNSVKSCIIYWELTLEFQVISFWFQNYTILA